MSVRPIVCGTELEEDHGVAELARALAMALGAPLELVHALDMLNDAPAHPAAIAPALEMLTSRVKERVEHARARLEAEGERIAAAGVECTTHLEQGRPWEAIVRRAETLAASFVVLGPHCAAAIHGHVAPGYRRWLGSTADRVVRHAPCPVLVTAFDPEACTKLEGATWIVGADAAPRSQTLIATARALARATSGKVVVVRVITPWREQEEPWDRATLEATDASGSGEGPAARVVLHGQPAHELAEVAVHTPGAVLVVGTHARNTLARLVLGSTTERLLRLARVPVLCVPDAAAAASDRVVGR